MYGVAILLGLVEGLTEFIPVSSTGHLILVGHLSGFTGQRADTFEVFIQLGAILAVAAFYRDRFLGMVTGFSKAQSGFSGARAIGLLALTTLPALVVGKLAHGYIKAQLFNPLTVALGLAVGGLGLIFVESVAVKSRKTGLDSLKAFDAFWIGCFQCLALWPGMSRSGSTIIGGILLGADRKTAAEYSFFAAVPIMFAAVSFDLYKNRSYLTLSDAPFFAAGFLISLIAAWVAIRFFLGFLAKHTLKGFGWYRLVLAGITWWYFTGR